VIVVRPVNVAAPAATFSAASVSER